MRIAIVNDMKLAIHAIAQTLENHSEHTVAWTAVSGAEAIQKCAQDLPDLLLMDMVMDGMDGVETTRAIMQQNPCPILIVTATVGGNCGMVFRAMGYGALDAVATPSLANAEGQKELLTKIGQLESLLTSKLAKNPPPVLKSFDTEQIADALVVIGTSAGGPAALSLLLSQLSPSFGAGIIIIQHIDAQFAPELAEWLTTTTKFPVRLAMEGDYIRPGLALLADGKAHLSFKNSRQLEYIQNEKSNYVPSVDVLFQSVASRWKGKLCGVLLTGMGKDGAVGLKMIRDLGFLTIAQDRASSALYGMPKSAAQINAASEILPLDCIAERLRRWVETLSSAP